ncbi:SAM-dependent methyltransferase [Kushneria phosphatilytica]|uniref:Methyltransferase domain-containing protein n=1 Tax=Kushneria phosphatilytica TaxID=657387 RepID=A0A1S1NRQ6_9GAMM|nr:SAM-dependent methyltransferase [Kushneria phosphatilytica]OHV07578.1 methyltransferase [Kushneria phosphatilytica]QEL10062.1 methyltransferase domain-containing protein [Kushneria phosphatilytica]
MTFHIETFEHLHAEQDDPWGYERYWYEQRKRQLTLAMLTRPRYTHAFEPGCSIGVLTRALAERCDRLLCSDASEAALAAAHQRLRDLPNVTLEQQALPQEWPAAQFDLIVFSELGYYLDYPALIELIGCMRKSLTADGELLACHWRHPIAGGALDGDGVHALLDDRLGLTRLAEHREPDLIMSLWSRDKRSPARREGLA